MKSRGSSSNLYPRNDSDLLQKVYLFVKWRSGIFGILIFITFIVSLYLKFSPIVDTEKTLQFSSIGANALKTSAEENPHGDIFYGIMLDAGSTGSRVHVYKFKNSKVGAAPVLSSELFEQVKPGLSSYADRPDDGAGSIEKLLLIAQKEIPKNFWRSTVLALKATAGLRLLPEAQADSLLVGVRNLFQEYPFKLANNAVEIMDGLSEGIYGWITVNYLLDRLGSSQKDQFSVGTIDLGGGSMQICFAPHEQETVQSAPRGFINEVSLFGTKMVLYTHSYLGLGLMSAREAALLDGEQHVESKVLTACMPRSYKQNWENGQKKYSIEGTGVAESSFQLCRQSAQNVVSKKMSQPVEIKHRTFYIFSYFFDRAVDAGLVDESEGGVITALDYVKAAERACSFDDFKEDQSFLCLDLSLITSILEDGFGFASDTKLITKQKIDGKETSWTLGAMFSLFD